MHAKHGWGKSLRRNRTLAEASSIPRRHINYKEGFTPPLELYGWGRGTWQASPEGTRPFCGVLPPNPKPSIKSWENSTPHQPTGRDLLRNTGPVSFQHRRSWSTRKPWAIGTAWKRQQKPDSWSQLRILDWILQWKKGLTEKSGKIWIKSVVS